MISSLPIYIGTFATFVATHFLASFVSSIPRREGTARLESSKPSIQSARL